MRREPDWPARYPTTEEIEARRVPPEPERMVPPAPRTTPHPVRDRAAFLAMLRGERFDGPSPVRTNPHGNMNHPGYLEWERANPIAMRVREAEEAYARRLAAKREPTKRDPDSWLG